MAMHVNGSEPGGFQSEINITPLVDVVLVLLIIFMVIVPLTLRGYDVSVPSEGPPRDATELELEQIVLAIDLDGCPVVEPPASPGLPDGCRVRLNDERLAVTELPGRVAGVFASRPETGRVLFLAVHDRVNYEAVLRVVDAARASVPGLRIGLATEREPVRASL